MNSINKLFIITNSSNTLKKKRKKKPRHTNMMPGISIPSKQKANQRVTELNQQNKNLNGSTTCNCGRDFKCAFYGRPMLSPTIRSIQRIIQLNEKAGSPTPKTKNHRHLILIQSHHKPPCSSSYINKAKQKKKKKKKKELIQQ